MENKKWNSILVDWVNCLKLCKPIQRLDDLRDGIFYSNLQKILKKTSEINTDVLTCLFHILSQNYPDFIINNNTNIHLSDLPLSDLSAITSLLMHYTCVHDRRDVLTSPLCHNLQQVTQICIKNFLEKIQLCPKVTTEELLNITEYCVEEGIKNLNISCHLQTVVNSSESDKSPLQDILRTPLSKNTKLLEKEREINKLKTKLELVQDEKESVEEDLKLQIEKNSRLEKQINQKTIEISRLRSEVLVLENRTPPHYQDKDLRETQRILRTKIDSLEQILKQCDKEIQDLSDERDAEKSQVKALETQCKVWFEKFVESDSKLRTLTEESKEQETKFINLSLHCQELEALLEELKSKPSDSFHEESFRCAESLNVGRKNVESLYCEDLAHSVIDVQLKDVQKENEQLKISLSELEMESKKCKEKINEYLQEINILKKEKVVFETVLNETKNKSEEILMKREEREKQFRLLTEECEVFKSAKENLSEELQQLQKEYDCIVIELEETRQKNTNIDQELEAVKFENKAVISKMNTVITELEKLTFEKKDICIKLEQVTNEKINVCKCLETEILKNKNISEDFNNVSKKLAVIINEHAELTAVVNTLKFEKKQFSDNLEKTLIDLKNVYYEKNRILEEKLNVSKELDNVNLKLKTANDRIYTISEELQSLMLKNEEMHIKYDKIVKEKSDIEETAKNLSEEHEKIIIEKQRIAENFQITSVQVQKLNESIYEIKEENLRLFKEQETVKEEFEKISKNLNETICEKEKISEYNEILKTKLETVTSEKNVLFTKFSDMLTQNTNNCKKLENAAIENVTLTERINEVRKEEEEVCKQLQDFINEKNILYKSYLEICLEKDKINDDLNSLNFEKKINNDNVQKICDELNGLKEERSLLLKDLKIMRNEKNLLMETNLAVSEILRNVEDKLNDVIAENPHVYDNLTVALLQNSETLIKLDEMDKEKDNVYSDFKELKVKAYNLSENIEILIEDKQTILTEKKELCKKVQELFDDLTQANFEKEQLIDKLKIVENEKKMFTEKFGNMQIEKEQSANNFHQIIQQKDKEIEIIVAENKNLLNKLETCSLNNNKLSEELEGVLKEKNNVFEELRNVLLHKQQISDKLLYVIKDKNEIECKLGQIIKEKGDISKQLQSVLSEKCELKKVAEENEKISEQVLQEKAIISNFLDLNTAELEKVNQERDTILDALEMSNKEVEKVIQEKKDITDQMSEERIHFLEQLAKGAEEKIEMAESLQLTKKELENLLKEKDDLSKHIAILTNDFKSLKLCLKGKQEELEIVSREKNNILEQYERVCQEKAEFSVQLDKVSQESVDIKKKLFRYSEEKLQLYHFVDVIKALLGKLPSELVNINEIEKILTEKFEIMNEFEANNKRLEKDLDEKSKIIENLMFINEELRKKTLTRQCSLPEHKNILELIDKISKEKIELAESLDLITKELEILSKEKHQLVESLEKTGKELQKVKRDRNEILESQTKIMKETENNILIAHENAVEVKNDLIKRIQVAEKEKQNLKNSLENDLQLIREAYANVVSTNSKYELENVNLRKKIEDKNKQLADYSQIKEAYEKLLEENNKLMTEVDTSKYKRSRDREDFVNLLKKERMEADLRESKKIREIKNDYEVKLEKMKEKMLKLYREEVNKEMTKYKAEQNETAYLQKTVNELKSNLFEAEQRIHFLETERDMLRMKESKTLTAPVSLRDRQISEKETDTTDSNGRSFKLLSYNNRTETDFNQLSRRMKSSSSTNLHIPGQKGDNERRMVHLPKSAFTEVEETITISRRTSINGVPRNIGIEMEDEEDDLFNNKYLADLKDGRCTLPLTGRESNVSRFSELAWRNSLVPPHLKSSYPAETQFLSPTHFKEDDIKAGNIEGDDSMCRLLPGEKTRQRKDFGTTSYKKPGPPTPSKNGGRLSLQGNEIQPLKEHNDKTPRKVTPSRIKALFKGRPSSNSLKENSENQCSTPRTKRLSIFRKQK